MLDETRASCYGPNEVRKTWRSAMSWFLDRIEDIKSYKVRKKYPSPDAGEMDNLIHIPRWLEIAIALALIAFMFWCES
jgi:hypothetical protein